MGPQDDRAQTQQPDVASQQPAQPGRGSDRNGASGEGASSALEAMLRRRQLRVDPQPDPSAGTASQPDGNPAKE